jgi:proteasome alpha subunit
MSYNLYDFNNAIQQRNEYIEERLREGSPVVGVSYDDGILLFTVRTTQRKVFEVYDRILMAALGSQSDIEDIRQAAIDTAHKEGFERSPDDVTLQRMIGFGLSRGLKTIYNDQRRIPLTFRGVFAEMGKTPADDAFFVLGFDGEYRTAKFGAIAAGTFYAEEQAAPGLTAASASLEVALRTAATAWGTAHSQLAPPVEKVDEDLEDEGPVVPDSPMDVLKKVIEGGATLEVGILIRNTSKESRFRLLTEDELKTVH